MFATVASELPQKRPVDLDLDLLKQIHLKVLDQTGLQVRTEIYLPTDRGVVNLRHFKHTVII